MSKYIDEDALIEYLKEQDEKYADGLTTNEICILIKNFPAADVQPVRKWILCGERLPELGKKVLVYWERFNRNTNEILGFADIMYLTSERGWYCEGQGEPNGKVIAWQPLSEPPKMDGGSE